MSIFSRLHVYNTMLERPIVPVFYHKDVEVAKAVVKACYDGGIRAFEFTNRGDFAHEIFAELNKWTIKNCPEMVLGIGSIVKPATAAIYLQIGASFVVGPMMNEEIFKICNRRQVAYIPEVVKVFAAGNVGGPSFVKNLKAPMPWTNAMVTGGVEPTEENLAAWFKGGVVCVGMGSKLFPSEVIQSGDWQVISKKCEEVIAIAKKYKQA